MPETTIRLPQPCHENWAAMAATTTGRHCARCQENVVDFTRMTEAEVVTFMRQHPLVSCGRFRESQLNRPLLAPAQAVKGWRQWWGATLALLGIGALAGPKAQGQTVPSAYWGGPAPAVAGQHQPVPLVPVLPTAPPLGRPVGAGSGAAAGSSDSLIIRGVVHNRLGFGQADARLRFRYGGRGHATTDEKGRFRLVVARKDLTERSQIYAVAWYKNDDDHYLKGEVAVMPAKTSIYVVHLKRHEQIRGGKFR